MNNANAEMDEDRTYCWFNNISDDVLLHIFLLIPRKDWYNVRRVCCRFRNVCHDKEIFRYSDFQYHRGVGLSEKGLQEYIKTGCQHIETLNLNHCYWFTSSFLQNTVSRCKKVHNLFLLDCKLTPKALSKIICSIECLKTLAITVSSLLEFSNEINGNQNVQNALQHLRHFVLHIREENGASVPNNLRLSQQTTVIEYSPHLESFCMIGAPGMSRQKLSRHLIHPLIVKTGNLSNLRTMSINCTADAASRLYFFGILVKSFDQAQKQFQNLSVSGLDFTQAVKSSYLIRSMKESCPTLESLDMSKVCIENLDAFLTIETPHLKYLNLADLRSESRCLGLLQSASHCGNLVSLNLKGATNSHKHWDKKEISALSGVLGNCRHLEHLNLSGVHIHGEDLGTSLVTVLTSHDISRFKSLAVSICCLVNLQEEGSSEGAVFVSKVPGKRQRISRVPQAGSSQVPDKSSSTPGEDVGIQRLYEACPNLRHLEIINTAQTAVLNSRQKTSPYHPCPVSYQFRDDQFSQLALWRNLRYLQVTGATSVMHGDGLKSIAKGCINLERLYLAYIGSAYCNMAFWDNLRYFKGILDLRLEQATLDLNERLFGAILSCEQLQRLVLIGKYGNVDYKAIANYVQRANSLHVIQVFADIVIKEGDKLRINLQKRFEKMRPGFQAVIEQIYHDRVTLTLESMPLVHLDEITDLSSRVASRPIDEFT
ncbi:F-box/LRR-repeat protein 18-like [Mya arenaria]|uniref:F-box/LRR-repeat protein 18-like n=1 Tax=Mya arenaria TaxID=6604 RepID=UPI0022E5F2F9|nr:F-box/LRR-repeat protein 18-like [Mya arenaria]